MVSFPINLHGANYSNVQTRKHLAWATFVPSHIRSVRLLTGSVRHGGIWVKTCYRRATGKRMNMLYPLSFALKVLLSTFFLSCTFHFSIRCPHYQRDDLCADALNCSPALLDRLSSSIHARPLPRRYKAPLNMRNHITPMGKTAMLATPIPTTCASACTAV
jgi:hypothetical protein